MPTTVATFPKTSFNMMMGIENTTIRSILKTTSEGIAFLLFHVGLRQVVAGESLEELVGVLPAELPGHCQELRQQTPHWSSQG